MMRESNNRSGSRSKNMNKKKKKSRRHDAQSSSASSTKDDGDEFRSAISPSASVDSEVELFRKKLDEMMAEGTSAEKFQLSEGTQHKLKMLLGEVAKKKGSLRVPRKKGPPIAERKEFNDPKHKSVPSSPLSTASLEPRSSDSGNGKERPTVRSEMRSSGVVKLKTTSTPDTSLDVASLPFVDDNAFFEHLLSSSVRGDSRPLRAEEAESPSQTAMGTAKIKNGRSPDTARISAFTSSFARKPDYTWLDRPALFARLSTFETSREEESPFARQASVPREREPLHLPLRSTSFSRPVSQAFHRTANGRAEWTERLGATVDLSQKEASSVETQRAPQSQPRAPPSSKSAERRDDNETTHIGGIEERRISSSIEETSSEQEQQSVWTTAADGEKQKDALLQSPSKRDSDDDDASSVETVSEAIDTDFEEEPASYSSPEKSPLTFGGSDQTALERLDEFFVRSSRQQVAETKKGMVGVRQDLNYMVEVPPEPVAYWSDEDEQSDKEEKLESEPETKPVIREEEHNESRASTNQEKVSTSKRPALSDSQNSRRHRNIPRFAETVRGNGAAGQTVPDILHEWSSLEAAIMASSSSSRLDPQPKKKEYEMVGGTPVISGRERRNQFESRLTRQSIERLSARRQLHFSPFPIEVEAESRPSAGRQNSYLRPLTNRTSERRILAEEASSRLGLGGASSVTDNERMLTASNVQFLVDKMENQERMMQQMQESLSFLCAEVTTLKTEVRAISRLQRELLSTKGQKD